MTLVDDTPPFEARRFALVGAGRLAELALDLWPSELRRPEFVLDSHKTGTLRDLAIFDLKTHRAMPDITYVMSAYVLPSIEAKAIFAHLGDRPVVTATETPRNTADCVMAPTTTLDHVHGERTRWQESATCLTTRPP